MSKKMPQDVDLDALVLKAQDGDKDAYAEIYDFYFDKIYRYVYFRVNVSDVDDIVETVFIKSWVNLEKYEKRDVSFGAWLFRIAHNAVIDHRRAHRPLVKMDASLEDHSREGAPKKVTEEVIMAGEIRDAVNRLKEPYRQVITLKFLMGLSNSEVSEILGEREGNVRVLQFRALKKLKQVLAEKGLEPEFL